LYGPSHGIDIETSCGRDGSNGEDRPAIRSQADNGIAKAFWAREVASNTGSGPTRRAADDTKFDTGETVSLATDETADGTFTTVDPAGDVVTGVYLSTDTDNFNGSGERPLQGDCTFAANVTNTP
jgi:hypothetical protein